MITYLKGTEKIESIVNKINSEFKEFHGRDILIWELVIASPRLFNANEEPGSLFDYSKKSFFVSSDEANNPSQDLYKRLRKELTDLDSKKALLRAGLGNHWTDAICSGRLRLFEGYIDNKEEQNIPFKKAVYNTITLLKKDAETKDKILTQELNNIRKGVYARGDYPQSNPQQEPTISYAHKHWMGLTLCYNLYKEYGGMYLDKAVNEGRIRRLNSFDSITIATHFEDALAALMNK